jgi:hypothetical protein
MANKTIPQLPLQTGITDNDLLAIVDSGETGGAFQTGDATDSIVPAYSPTSRGVDANTTYVDKLNVNLSNALDIDNGVNNTYNIIGGYGTRGVVGGSLGSAVVGGRNPQIAGNANFVAGQFGSSIAGENNGMVGGRGNFITGGEYSFLGGGRSNSNSSFYSGILAGQNNNVSTATHAVILGGQSNSITSRFDNAILAGNSNSNAARYGVVVGGQNNQLQNGSQRGVIVGGLANTVSEGLHSAIVGGNGGTVSLTWNSVNIAPYFNGIYHDQTHQQWEGFSLYSAPNSYIRQTAGSGTGAIKGGNCSIFNSYQSDIAGQTGNETNFGTIIGSESSQITGGTRGTVMIGCSGRTGVSSHTTYVETLEAFEGIVMTDYANLNFANDSAAATGGVPLGGMYHNAGNMRIRIT